MKILTLIKIVAIAIFLTSASGCTGQEWIGIGEGAVEKMLDFCKQAPDPKQCLKR